MESRTKIDIENFVDRRLRKFIFPIREEKVFFGNIARGSLKKTNDYKAIIRNDKKQLISVMKESYKVVPNRDIIIPLITELTQLDTSWIIDPSHSFVDSFRMRLQITFPLLKLNDGESTIALSLFLHNSYDGSEGVRILWGAIRAICSNGMIWGEILQKYYHRHTQGIDLSNLKEQIKETYERIPVIRERINILKTLEVTESIKTEVEEQLGKTISKYVNNNMPVDQWALYNLLTYYISHYINLRNRAHYQIAVSRLFRL